LDSETAASRQARESGHALRVISLAALLGKADIERRARLLKIPINYRNAAV